jgi:effector-binding domain-containing protein
MLETPQIRQSTAHQTAIIRFTIPREQIQEVMGPGIGELMSALATQGVMPAGPIFSHHFKMDPEIFDFEIGVPVLSPVNAIGRVTMGELPAIRVARTVYHGPYQGLADAWCEFGEWIRANGHSPAPDLWECYTTGPESGPDSSKWRTELNRPLQG